jgi:hypothetical protein
MLFSRQLGCSAVVERGAVRLLHFQDAKFGEALRKITA